MKKPVVSVVSLGCPKNTVDTERLLALFALRGILVAEDPEDAVAAEDGRVSAAEVDTDPVVSTPLG